MVSADESAAFCGAKKPGPQRHFLYRLLEGRARKSLRANCFKLKILARAMLGVPPTKSRSPPISGGSRAQLFAFRGRDGDRFLGGAPGTRSRHYGWIDHLDDRAWCLDRHSLFQG